MLAAAASRSNMGYSLSWLAVKGKAQQILLRSLGLRSIGNYVENIRTPPVGAELTMGWYLAIVGRSGHRLIRDSFVAQFSSHCEVVTVDLEEHVMVSAATGWRKANKIWSVKHDGQRGVEHLVTEGQLPSAFSGIRENFCHKQQTRGADDADVDYYFDIPIEVAKAVTGYRHDEQFHELRSGAFEVLDREAGKLPWLAR
jgi:hypothetical protein